ncbi:MAG: NAD(P)-dependent oxidoreductase [Pirellulaceae bacterium]|nr:NAD(P)-dependent oxidoreductase [Pirellulaceae bacterium]
MNVLLTGGHGTIGGYVTRELQQAGHTVADFSRTPTAEPGVCWIQGDITQPDQLRQAAENRDVIVHLAGIPGPGRATPAELLHVNVIGTVNVLEAAVEAGVRRVVFASSGAATGFSFPKRKLQPKYLPLDEQHPCEPHDEYGLSKLLGELACKRYSDAFGLQTICLRINNNWYLDRVDVESVVKRGWATAFSGAEDLWGRRYRKTIEDPHGEGDWPVPGPPLPANLLWAFTDARDAAKAFRLAVENDTFEHEVFLINGYDTCSNEPTRELVARHYPDVPLQATLEDHATLWSYEKAQRLLGYEPAFTWRESDFAVWLAQQEGSG